MRLAQQRPRDCENSRPLSTPTAPSMRMASPRAGPGREGARRLLGAEAVEVVRQGAAYEVCPAPDGVTGPYLVESLDGLLAKAQGQDDVGTHRLWSFVRPRRAPSPRGVSMYYGAACSAAGAAA